MIIKCPNCNVQLDLPENLAGQKCECPECKTKFVCKQEVSEEIVPPENENGMGKDENVRETQEEIIPLEDAEGSRKDKGIRETSEEIIPLEDAEDTGKDEYVSLEDAPVQSPKVSGSVHSQPNTGKKPLIENSAERRKLKAFFKRMPYTEAMDTGVKNFIPLKGKIKRNFGIVHRNDFIGIVSAYHKVQSEDMAYLESLDMLPYVGKDSSQLVAKPRTLFSPAVDCDEDYKEALVGKYDEFVYSLESIMKIYIFEDQLVTVKALWDYTTGTLFNECSEAFFFRDITNVSTTNAYMKVYPKISLLKQFLVTIAVIGVLLIISAACHDDEAAAFVFCVSCLALVGFFVYAICKFLKRDFTRIRHYETFTITASSGQGMGISILCNEWLAASNATFKKRTDTASVIQAVRKMVEEKKVQ